MLVMYMLHASNSHTMSMSTTFVGGAVGREFESEAPAAEEIRRCHMQQRTVQFSDVL